MESTDDAGHRSELGAIFQITNRAVMRTNTKKIPHSVSNVDFDRQSSYVTPTTMNTCLRTFATSAFISNESAVNAMASMAMEDTIRSGKYFGFMVVCAWRTIVYVNMMKQNHSIGNSSFEMS